MRSTGRSRYRGSTNYPGAVLPSTALQFVSTELADLAAVKYALIVRVRVLTPSKHKGRKIVYGSVAGDVLIYEQPSGKRLAAFPFKLTGRAYGGMTIKTDNEDEKLAVDLQSSIFEQLDAELAKFVAAK